MRRSSAQPRRQTRVRGQFGVRGGLQNRAQTAQFLKTPRLFQSLKKKDPPCANHPQNARKRHQKRTAAPGFRAQKTHNPTHSHNPHDHRVNTRTAVFKLQPPSQVTLYHASPRRTPAPRVKLESSSLRTDATTVRTVLYRRNDRRVKAMTLRKITLIVHTLSVGKYVSPPDIGRRARCNFFLYSGGAAPSCESLQPEKL